MRPEALHFEGPFKEENVPPKYAGKFAKTYVSIWRGPSCLGGPAREGAVAKPPLSWSPRLGARAEGRGRGKLTGERGRDKRGGNLKRGLGKSAQGRVRGRAGRGWGEAGWGVHQLPHLAPEGGPPGLSRPWHLPVDLAGSSSNVTVALPTSCPGLLPRPLLGLPDPREPGQS